MTGCLVFLCRVGISASIGPCLVTRHILDGGMSCVMFCSSAKSLSTCERASSHDRDIHICIRNDREKSNVCLEIK